MATNDSKDPLSVAVVGGGIAGLTLTIAILTHCPHINITLYEAAAAFGEIGAGVGFQPVMVRTMKLIDPRIEDAFHKCNKDNEFSDPPRWFTVRVGDQRKVIRGVDVVHQADHGKKEVLLGEELFVIPCHRGPRGGVHRAHFLDELVKLIPEGITRFRKRLMNITIAEGSSGPSILHFADGTVAQHDAVIGCDGIKSCTRTLVFGDDDAAKARFSGKYAYRGLIPMSKAVDILGEEIPKTAQMFLGYHGHVLTFPIANGTIMNVVAFSSQTSWTTEEWVVKTSKEDMLEDFKHWSPAVRDVMNNMQSADIWALFEHPPIPIYYSRSPLVCLVGDAAHASTPHQGAGAGMCIEDAYILSGLLKKCTSSDDLAKAFHAYDAVRRPRTQKLVRTSKEAGMLWDFEGSGIGDDIEALERDAVSRMGWIWDHEVAEDLLQAEEIMAMLDLDEGGIKS